jgi:amino acid transporter
MLIATYDYWGYYNVAFLGGEVREPARNIPRALIYSILAVAALYLAMNISILGVISWRELEASARAGTHLYVVSLFMQRIYGEWAARIITVLVMWTAFASVFSLLLGYSRIPYAAALDGNYFRVFGRLHLSGRFPAVSLVALGLVACIFCFLRLADVIAALVIIRIVIQFLVQAIGLLLWRARHPEAPRPFRMWFYPLPAFAAIAGFIYVIFARKNFANELRLALLIAMAGLIVYLARAHWRREWPFARVPSTA